MRESDIEKEGVREKEEEGKRDRKRGWRRARENERKREGRMESEGEREIKNQGRYAWPATVRKKWSRDTTVPNVVFRAEISPLSLCLYPAKTPNFRTHEIRTYRINIGNKTTACSCIVPRIESYHVQSPTIAEVLIGVNISSTVMNFRPFRTYTCCSSFPDSCRFDRRMTESPTPIKCLSWQSQTWT